jgi:5-methyltetrahydrofolate--homocysteine methyltransferase
MTGANFAPSFAADHWTNMPNSSRPPVESLLQQRILILDGAMGTMLQTYGLTDKDFHGDRFADHKTPLRGFNDLLSITRPDVIEEVHRAYLEAGADIIETNTFNATKIGMADYDMEHLVRELNFAAVAVARRAADDYTAKNPDKPRYVAGSIGPTTKTASISPKVADPGYRAVTFDELVEVYGEQVEALVEAGVDILFPETTFDTLNLKACLFSISRYFDRTGKRLPVMVSVTITDKSGRTLSGQTTEAFWESIRHFPMMTVGINCALGAEDMRPYLETLSKVATCGISCHPNAGLPDGFGSFDDPPENMSKVIGEFARNGWLNIVGGCCGTSPEYIRQIAAAVKDYAPRPKPTWVPKASYSGLEPISFEEGITFLNVGERTNITGSRKFARLIREGKFDEAVAIARDQVDGGANVIDVNMDEGLIDGVAAMTRFLNLIAAEPDISRVPVMIDSSRFDVIEAGLKCVQGRSIVNSISLKEGEEKFLEQARLVNRYGAAVVVMAFDETGQATEVEHKVSICKRAYDLLIEKAGYQPTDIIFDSNILTVGTGIEEHNRYAVNFFEALSKIKEACPGARTSGGVSNVSFSFRGNDLVREAMNSAFLYHAIQAGLDMAIINPTQLMVYQDIPADLLEKVEDVLFDRRPDASDRLIEFAETLKGTGKKEKVKDEAWRAGTVEERLAHGIIQGLGDHLEVDLAEAMTKYKPTLTIIEGPLMDAMNVVGDRFGAGQMFLPQVVKSARVMKKAVSILMPHMEAEKAAGAGERKARGKILMATVKGDVHDIGKNIVGVVLGCNDYDIIDLGVMCQCDHILKKAREHDVDMIGLSGLITPSLEEMTHVASEMQREGFKIPLLIGGATTSPRHTAVKIAPSYENAVVHVKDASKCVGVVDKLIRDETRPDFLANLAKSQEEERAGFARKRARNLVSFDMARAGRYLIDWDTYDPPRPSFVGIRTIEDLPLTELVPFIDWSPFFMAWEFKGKFPEVLRNPTTGPEATKLYEDALRMLDRLVADRTIRASGVYGFLPAHTDGEDIVCFTDESKSEEAYRFPMLRQQWERVGQKHFLSLSDFVAPAESGKMDYLGGFAVTAGIGADELALALERADHDTYNSILVKALADRFAEAFAEYLHRKAREDWGYGRSESLSNDELISEKYQGIRPAPGYPACPDHMPKRTLWNWLEPDARCGISLTESLAMYPAASVSGWYFSHPESRYFAVDWVTADQVADYASRCGISVKEAERWLAPNLSYDPVRETVTAG